MSDKQYKISDNKIFEYNEKSFKDTMQLFNEFNKIEFNKFIESLNNNVYLANAMDNLTITKGREVWIKLKVEDTYLSNLLFSWMFNKSQHDGSSGLDAFGCKIVELGNIPDRYSDEEKEAIKVLYNKIFKEE